MKCVHQGNKHKIFRRIENNEHLNMVSGGKKPAAMNFLLFFGKACFRTSHVLSSALYLSTISMRGLNSSVFACQWTFHWRGPGTNGVCFVAEVPSVVYELWKKPRARFFNSKTAYWVTLFIFRISYHIQSGKWRMRRLCRRARYSGLRRFQLVRGEKFMKYNLCICTSGVTPRHSQKLFKC